METGGWGIMSIMKVSAHMNKNTPRRLWVNMFLGICFLVFSVGVIGFGYFVLKGRIISQVPDVTAPAIEEVTEVASAQFPVGVDMQTEEIIENPKVDTYFYTYVSSKKDDTSAHTSWLPRIFGKLALMNWYQNLASLSTRILVVESGERKEEVASHFSKILNWDKNAEEEFLASIVWATPELADGKFFPGSYVVARGATPAEVAPLIIDRFKSEVLARYGTEVESRVPLAQALIVASLLEREAYDFEDMRHISGVIWNRLFTDMRLQIDATLQYAKGSKPSQPWWPKVIPNDKYIASVYNTYKNEGLPPAPIANPSLDAILAALNPTKTDCMYYFHDKHAEFHCSKTYEEHVNLLKQYYGRGK